MKNHMIAVVCLIVLSVLGAEELPGKILAETSVFANAKECKSHEVALTRPQDGKSAVVTFPVGKWSAVIIRLPLPAEARGSVALTSEVRWIGDFANAKHTSMELRFLDDRNKNITGGESSGKSAFVQKKSTVQKLSWTLPVPEGATAFTVYFSSHGGGTLELLSFKAVLLP